MTWHRVSDKAPPKDGRPWVVFEEAIGMPPTVARWNPRRGWEDPSLRPYAVRNFQRWALAPGQEGGEPERCCTGEDCGCLGLPIHPPEQEAAPGEGETVEAALHLANRALDLRRQFEARPLGEHATLDPWTVIRAEDAARHAIARVPIPQPVETEGSVDHDQP